MSPSNCITRALSAAALFGIPHLAAQARPAAPPKSGTIVVTVALVDRDMQVRPVPLHALALTGARADTFTTRTATDGRASVVVPPGLYTLTSVAPIECQGRR